MSSATSLHIPPPGPGPPRLAPIQAGPPLPPLSPSLMGKIAFKLFNGSATSFTPLKPTCRDLQSCPTLVRWRRASSYNCTRTTCWSTFVASLHALVHHPCLPPLPGKSLNPPFQNPENLLGLAALVQGMQTEIDQLKSKVQALTLSLVASPPSLPITSRVVPPLSTISNPPSPTSSVSTALSRTAHPGHLWLQCILDHKDLSPYLHHVDSEMMPQYHHAVPDDVPSILMVHSSNQERPSSLWV
ncbi:hypothetical protein L210DRAFT_982584 [Boletus edulis BED1]|uniref:Uncharacterized protein n=1 Tax=Boletus edulis BED1 TaxID=1328754 RepID=A0AAD4BKE2_BOLED|nr:hypothetical protein L210DRAFT_982584 [Boletus edulis BED1]